MSDMQTMREWLDFKAKLTNQILNFFFLMIMSLNFFKLLKTYMVINFRICEISRDTYKLVQTST